MKKLVLAVLAAVGVVVAGKKPPGEQGRAGPLGRGDRHPPQELTTPPVVRRAAGPWRNW
ncbi:hypothetical protein G5V59_16670 [Nocardioides sp. W3-2-3]|uniref:hypothetical protein n=1 Tax=Nocardioides convexus TaxID=2712224 RepID=UPI002418BAC9|nr:hypothetical protein [Nocardioides convexus]NHA00976.1 hypothetical protein [Nocardioides convexus]